MTSNRVFNGFSKETVRFYEELTLNNNREWFQEQKEVFQEYVIEPSLAFVEEMGSKLKKISPNLIADPRLNGGGSIFRIYRDIRFSKDKTPYKTFLGILFWEGKRKKVESTGFYFQMQPPRLMLSVGTYTFSRSDLEIFREAILDEELCFELRQIIKNLQADKQYKIGGHYYEKIPQGFNAHSSNHLLKYNGLYVTCESRIPDVFYSPDLINYCFEHFVKMSPVFNWLASFVIESV